LNRHAKMLISVLYLAARGAGERLLSLLGLKREPRLVVLCYHSVPAAKKSGFERQMDEVARYARVVYADASTPISDRPCVAITFDDAFESVAQNALDGLVRRDFRATIFVPTGVLGRSPDWKFNASVGDKAEQVMTMKQLASLDQSLIRFGCHTVSHPYLTSLDDQQLQAELLDSKRLLESGLNRPISTLAFPYGDHDERVIEACRRAGYGLAFSILPGTVTPNAGKFVRGRVTVEPDDTPFEFWLKIRGAYSWAATSSALKRRLTRRGVPSPSKERFAS
jgi:peptidoglycan/xylan/chitin deacetylase (PgdA/CDA1 family)